MISINVLCIERHEKQQSLTNLLYKHMECHPVQAGTGHIHETKTGDHVL